MGLPALQIVLENYVAAVIASMERVRQLEEVPACAGMTEEEYRGLCVSL